MQARNRKNKIRLKNFKFNKITKLLIVSILGLLLLILVAFHLVYRQKIYPGVTILNLPVGNLTPNETTQKISQYLAANQASQITLFYQQQEFVLDLRKTDFSTDLDSTIQKAYQVGRSGRITKDFKTKISAWFKGIDLNLEYHLNDNFLKQQIEDLANQLFIPKIDPQIILANQQIKIEPGQDGQELDQTRLNLLINSHLAQNDFNPIELPVNHLSSSLTEQQVKEASQRAEKLLNHKLVLAHGEEKWELGSEELIKLINIRGGFNSEKIASQSASLAKVIDREAQNATFQFEKGRVLQFQPPTDGLTLDQQKTQELIKASLTEIENQSPMGVLSSNQEMVLNLPVIITQPEITIDQVNDLGIKELLGTGISNYKGSVQSRIHNLTLASSRLNGLLIPPDTIFSFNTALGDVSQDTGYQSAYIIKEGRTILGDGGGVCQVSTTFFRAILNSGLPIVERHPHAYRVSYYEQGGFGPGLDATVWQPGVDLKFKNNTPAHVLIQTKVEPSTMTLTFELYGTSDGRQVTLSKPKIWDRTSPPPDLYQDDPTLTVGTVKQIEHAIPGAKVSVNWEVVRNGETLIKQTIYSQYQAWQAVYLRGTKPI